MQPSLIAEVRDLARGRWPVIIASVAEPTLINGKHQPCPMCGGADRFRFTNYQQEGRYYCSGCGPGDGLDLMAGLLGVDIKSAAREVRRLCGVVPTADDVFTEEPNIEDRKISLNRMWQDAQQKIIATQYLKSRGCYDETMQALYQDLRGGKIWHRERNEKMNGMLAMVRDVKGRPVSIHRTFLDIDGNRLDRKVMPPVGDLNGCAIRLGDVADRVVIGEGVETTLSGCLKMRWPGMAAINANLMQAVKLPPSVQYVVILADNDLSFTGQAAAFTLARRLDNDKKKVAVFMPKRTDYDFNDDPVLFHRWRNHIDD